MSTLTAKMEQASAILTADLAQMVALFSGARQGSRPLTLVEDRPGIVTAKASAPAAEPPVVLTASSPAHAPMLVEGAAMRLAGNAVTLCLSPDRFLVSERVFPAAAQSYLSDIIAAQIDTWTPWNKAQVLVGHEIVDRTEQQVTIRVFAADRAPIDAVVRALRGGGASAVTVMLAARPDSTQAITLAPQEGAHGTDCRHRTIQAALAGIVALMALLYGVTAWLGLGLNDREVALRAELSARAGITAVSDPAAAGIQRKSQGPLTIIVLDELARLLPDSVWLTGLELAGDQVQIQGHAKDAAGLIGLLATSPSFAAPQFAAPMTRDGPNGTETFRIAFTLKSREGSP